MLSLSDGVEYGLPALCCLLAGVEFLLVLVALAVSHDELLGDLE